MNVPNYVLSIAKSSLIEQKVPWKGFAKSTFHNKATAGNWTVGTAFAILNHFFRNPVNFL